MTDIDAPDNNAVKTAVSICLASTAAAMDAEAGDDTREVIREGWPANIPLHAMLIGEKIVEAIFAFAGLSVAQLYEFAGYALPDES